jgi:hypothetical protein
MIETPPRWHSSAMRLRFPICLLSLFILACDQQEEGEPCQPPEEGVPSTYTVSLVGFPEVSGDTLVADQLDYEGPCVVDAMDFVADQLTLSLSCEHPAPSIPEGASVTITTAAEGLPANVAVGDTLTFLASAIDFEHIGGDASGGVFRALEYAGVEYYALADASGPVFTATRSTLNGGYGPVEVVAEYNCPDFQPCGGSNYGWIAAHVRASVGDTAIDVQVGEVGLLEGGDLAWDVSLFSAALDDQDCHDGESGSLSVVRRPS